MPTATVNKLDMLTERKNLLLLPSIKKVMYWLSVGIFTFYLEPFQWHKVNILKVVIYSKTLLLQLNRKSCIGFQLSFLNLTLIHSKGHGQGHAHFDNVNILEIVKY